MAFTFLLSSSVPAFAARPLLDRHQWDAYFALFARDVNVPWKTTTIRLDTYSSAPVDFAAYNVDPAEVIVAGQNHPPRALDTGHRVPIVRWRFSPPAGYRFETSDVPVPLGSQEGFYVIEARRGDAVQQIWINRTHIGLLTKESPEGLVLWGVDLRSGRALAHLPVAFLVGLTLIGRQTADDGTIVWREHTRPTFALAEQGAGRAFISILPQPPLPPAIVGLRAESAVGRTGDRVRFVGFARKRSEGRFRRAAGDVRVALAGHGTTLASVTVHLDAAGAFTGELGIPTAIDAGDYALLASTAGAVGGTTVHIDAAGDVALTIRSLCPCEPDRDVPFSILARRGTLAVSDVPVRVQVVRTPHVVPPGASDDAVRWGTTSVYDRLLRTNTEGRVSVTIPSPSDGLDSTYGVRATTRGATATSRVVVPSARIALALEPVAPTADVGAPIAFELRGFDPSDGAPAPGVAVTVRLSHGVERQEQSCVLDARGEAHVVFRQTSLGANLAIAEATVDGRKALDATQVTVEPSALSSQPASATGGVAVALDKLRYRPGDGIVAQATAPGTAGDALFTVEGAKTYALRRVSVSGAGAQATLALDDAQGAVRIGVAVVRDGAFALGSAAVNVEGPGRPRVTELVLDRTAYAPGEVLHATIHDGGTRGGATLAVRIADGRESGSALFEDAPEVLASGATTSQAPASDDPEWHAYVAPARSKASDIFAAEQPRKVAAEVPTIGAAAPRTLFWRVARLDGLTFDLPVPNERGHFVLSILKIDDDGGVGAAAVGFNVQ